MRRLVIVVGMHRSGTSAMTRALASLGVGLGSDFLDLMPEVNQKGFWEDRSLNAINIRLLESLGLDWFSNRAPDLSKLQDSSAVELASEARVLLNRKIPENGVFAFKDPRTTVLLPFWNQVCASIDIEPSYLVALRHPRSIADSIDKRNGFASAKTYYLWLRHVVASLLDTAGYRRVLVEYDRLLDTPALQLNRISDALDLDSGNRQAQDNFVSDFLEKELCHNRYSMQDLQSDPAAPLIVISVYRLLNEVANDSLSIDAPEVIKLLTTARNILAEMEPFAAYADNLEYLLANHSHTEIDSRRISALKAALGMVAHIPDAPKIAEIHSSPPESWTKVFRTRLAKLLK